MKRRPVRAVRNVTLAIPEKVLQKARVRAAREGTSVNEVIRERLVEYGAQEERLRDAVKELLAIAAKYKGNSRGWKFNREEIHVRNPDRGW